MVPASHHHVTTGTKRSYSGTFEYALTVSKQTEKHNDRFLHYKNWFSSHSDQTTQGTNEPKVFYTYIYVVIFLGKGVAVLREENR